MNNLPKINMYMTDIESVRDYKRAIILLVIFHRAIS